MIGAVGVARDHQAGGYAAPGAPAAAEKNRLDVMLETSPTKHAAKGGKTVGEETEAIHAEPKKPGLELELFPPV